MGERLVRAGGVEELRAAGRRVVSVGGAPVLVLWHEGAFHAMDNRCPHMGFPLSQGDVHDGLLDCHWHHARFDVTCGATLDPWADDVAAYRVVERDGELFVDPDRPQRDPREHGLVRLGRGLEDNLSLVTTKAVVALAEAGVPVAEPVAAVARYGATRRDDGWQPGLSVLAAAANLLPSVDPLDRQRALARAASFVASDCAGRPPRNPLPGLAGSGRDRRGLTAWFRETVEVRDADGAERVLRTMVEEQGPVAALDAVLAACTDHRYADVGHSLDYAVKCAELADHVGETAPGTVPLLFTALVPQLVGMQRMEETSAWRRPVDVAALVEAAAEGLPAEPFVNGVGAAPEVLEDEDDVVALLLGTDPAAAAEGLVRRLRGGAGPVALAEAVVLAATQRVLRFGTANEVADWDTVHHTLTYANAVAEGMRRAPSRELFRGVLDAAMSVYLDRFLNVPPAALPRDREEPDTAPPEGMLPELLGLYDRRGSVDAAGTLAWRYLEAGGRPARLLGTLAHAVFREDAGFHEAQQVDLAWRRLARRGDCAASRLALVATARWVAAQFPTRRAREQTFSIVRRLHRGEPLHEG